MPGGQELQDEARRGTRYGKVIGKNLVSANGKFSLTVFPKLTWDL